jgi:acyl-coenzyme A thioesterase PaaI-like protein
MTEAELLALEPAPLDAGIGLALQGFEDDVAILRLDPPVLAAVGSDGGGPEYLHGGALATCVDTAAWYAVVHGRDGDWVMADMRCDFVRMAAREPHRVTATCLRAGRMLATVDVHIAPWDRPERTVALGRAQLARTDRG